ncbi:MAG: RsiV family protein [Bacteroidales bacterium]|nr:RsiV family protein [Bacteroidales bacterium]
MNKQILPFLAAVLLLAASCGGQQPTGVADESSASLTLKTIAVEEVLKHPKGVSDADGLTYKVHFTYPAGHTDKAVLEKLQQQFIAHTLGQRYSSLTPEEAVNACIADWQAAYNGETANEDEFDFRLRWKMTADNAILFMNEDLLQLETNSSVYDGGNYDAGGMSYHLFNPTTGNEYCRNDIFKPESAENIRRLIIPELNNVWNAGNVSFDNNKVWTPNTHFAVTQEGIRIFYRNFEICDCPFGTVPFTIPYNKIAPYLREDTPVWNIVFGQTQTNVQSIARTLAAQVPEINEKYDRTHSNDDHYLYRSAEDDEYGDRNLQMYWYERPTAPNDWVLVSSNYHPDSWLKCFTFDRNTETLTETDLPFTIPSAHEFDSEEFDKEQTYWRSDYTICENGDIIISASPGMNAICVTFAHWDNESFTLYKRGIDFSYGEPVEDDAAAEMYVKNAIRPNFQRINAIENWTWIDEKTVSGITPQPATLTYYYSDKGLEKIVAALTNETVEYYFLERYLSFVYSKSDAGKEQRWYVKKGSCFRGIGDNGKILLSEAREEEYGEVDVLFGKIMGR